MPSYKIKKAPEGQPPYRLNLQTGSRKGGNKETKVYESGQSVSLSPEQALSHASILELSDAQAEKLAAESEAPSKKK